jgi:hypothetical protein
MRVPRSLLGPLVAGLAVGVWVAAFRRYAPFDFADEGVLLAQASRAAHGQAPYLDFRTGYGPLYFAAQAVLFRAGGVSAIRGALVLVHGVAAALLFALVRRLSNGALAAAVVLFSTAFFLPLAPALGAPFYVPYPAWYAEVGILAAALLLAGRPLRFALTGAVAGTVTAVKPNSGVLLLAAGAAVAVLDGKSRMGGMGKAVLWAIATLAVLLVGSTGASLAAAVLVPPVFGLVFLGGRYGATDGAAMKRLLALGVGFIGVSLASFARSMILLGPTRFLREALLVGSGVAQVYAVPYPWAGALAAAAGVAGFFFAERIGRGFPVVALGVTALAAGAAAGAAPGLPAALRVGGEAAAFAAVPLAVWGGLALLRRRPGSPLLPLTAIAALGSLQLYPRPDFVHLMAVGPLLLPLGARLWVQAAGHLRSAPLRLLVLFGVPLVAAAARLAPTAGIWWDQMTGRLVPVAVGDVTFVVEPPGAPRLRGLARAVEAVRRLSGPDTPVASFPACAIVTALAGRPPAGPHDYFFPGRPDQSEAASLVASWVASPPSVAVTCDAAGTDLARAWTYYPEIVHLLETRYRPVVDAPPFTVRALRRP